MKLTQMIQELRAERENIEQAIVVLERLAAGRSKRRGQPPALMGRLRGVDGQRGVKTNPSRSRIEITRVNRYQGLGSV